MPWCHCDTRNGIVHHHGSRIPVHERYGRGVSGWRSRQEGQTMLRRPKVRDRILPFHLAEEHASREPSVSLPDQGDAGWDVGWVDDQVALL